MKIIRTNSENVGFVELVSFLDRDLAERDGDDHSFYAQFNKIDTIKYVVLVFDQDVPIACGAMKEFDKQTMEIKRMYTTNNRRGKGIAARILNELEIWATELSYSKCVLETGINQSEAIGLYKKSGYSIIPNYGQYANVQDSRCFEKVIL
jgi:putative acetyltransferase